MKSGLKLALAALCCASMWLYVSRVLVQRQKSEAAAFGIPRGNLSDLYPVWLGSRELLLHRKDPYSQEITRQIQARYYGRALDASRSQDPTNQQAFAYPVYVAFLLAPAVQMPFAEVQAGFRLLLTLLTGISVLLWLRTLGWKPGRDTTAALVLLTLATFAAVQGIKLQQLSLLVAALLAGSLALLVSGQLLWSGILLAFAMIKPQLTIPLVGWLLLWTSGRLRTRWRLAASFVAGFAALVLGGEYVLPGWIGKFRVAIAAYREYATSGSLLEQMLTPGSGMILAAVAVAGAAAVCWRARTCAAAAERFVRVTSLVLAVTVLITPMFPPHYQLLLLPGVFLLVRHWRVMWRASFANRSLLLLSGILVLWQWTSAGALVVASLFGPRGERFWELPLWTSVFVPIPLTACLVLLIYQARAADQAKLTAGS